MIGDALAEPPRVASTNASIDTAEDRVGSLSSLTMRGSIGAIIDASYICRLNRSLTDAFTDSWGVRGLIRLLIRGLIDTLRDTSIGVLMEAPISWPPIGGLVDSLPFSRMPC